jgi:hypothetical protein
MPDQGTPVDNPLDDSSLLLHAHRRLSTTMQAIVVLPSNFMRGDSDDADW